MFFVDNTTKLTIFPYLSRRLLFFSLVISVGCSSQVVPRQAAGPHGVSLFVSERTNIEEYFQSHQIMVSDIRLLDESNKVSAHYPSVNRGPSPLYSHIITINVPDDVPLSLEDLAVGNDMVILEASSEPDTWILVGFVASGKRPPPFDWFSDKQELIYTH